MKNTIKKAAVGFAAGIMMMMGMAAPIMAAEADSKPAYTYSIVYYSIDENGLPVLSQENINGRVTKADNLQIGEYLAYKDDGEYRLCQILSFRERHNGILSDVCLEVYFPDTQQTCGMSTLVYSFYTFHTSRGVTASY